MERKYTVEEIDDLRDALETRYLFGTTKMTPGVWHSSGCFDGREKNKAVEQRLRTHMLAGHTAKDIYDADNVRQA